MVKFEVLTRSDIPAAVEALLETATAFPGNYFVGPFDDAELLETRTVYVTGADEVEAAQVLVGFFGELGVAWRAS